jgi:hypothetical protein
MHFQAAKYATGQLSSIELPDADAFEWSDYEDWLKHWLQLLTTFRAGLGLRQVHLDIESFVELRDRSRVLESVRADLQSNEKAMDHGD